MATRKATADEKAKPATEAGEKATTPKTEDRSVRGTSGERERAARRAQAEDPKAEAKTAKRPETKPSKHSRHDPEERDVAPIDPAVVEVREDSDGTWIINDPTGTDTEPTTVQDKSGYIDPENPPERPDKTLEGAEPMLPPTEAEGERQPGDDTVATKAAREVSLAADKDKTKR